jgi:competence protein ComEA
MKKVILPILASLLLALASVTYASPVNINEASAEQISDSLVGVGLKKAEAIVRYREQYGHFNSAEELVNVKGIGAETLEKNKSNIVIE